MIWNVVLTIGAVAIVLVAVQTSRIATLRAIHELTRKADTAMATNQEQLVELKTTLTAVVSQQTKVLGEIGALADRAENSNVDPAIISDLRGLVGQLQGGVQTLDNYTPDTIEAEEGTTPPPAGETPGTTEPETTPPVVQPGESGESEDGTDDESDPETDPEDSENPQA